MKRNKTVNFSFFGLLAALSASLFCIPLRAETGPPVQRVLLKEGALFMVRNGVSLPMTNEVTLPHEITVLTNGAFKVKSGKERPLLEGQILGADGMLTSPNGTVRPVFDHIALLEGQPMIMKDGEVSELQADTILPDGQRVTADGYLAAKSGGRRKLLDGEIINLTGKLIPAQDTVTLQDGKVTVQKDGSSLEVAPGRSIMMNDGTKVFGDGTVVTKDGVKKTLAPGEILKVEGVMVKSR